MAINCYPLKKQGLTEIKINQLMVGQEPPAKKRISRSSHTDKKYC